jgi:hypothetical protein
MPIRGPGGFPRPRSKRELAGQRGCTAGRSSRSVAPVALGISGPVTNL